MTRAIKLSLAVLAILAGVAAAAAAFAFSFGGSAPIDLLDSALAWLERGWLQALLGAAVLATALVALRFARGLAPLRSTARRTAWFYPAASFALAALAVLAVYPLLAPPLRDFAWGADWCVSCKEMERFTFSDPVVRQRMAQMQLLQVDVTRNTDADKAFLERFGIFGPPGIMFFDTSGTEMRELRVIGFQSAERFAPTLSRVLQAPLSNQRR